MPQLNPLDWGPQLIWLVITFGVLYLLMVWIALPRIGNVIEKRAAHIAGDLGAAEKFRRRGSAAEGEEQYAYFCLCVKAVRYALKFWEQL